MEHLLKMLDLSAEEITDILNTADQLEYEKRHDIPHPHLADKTPGMIFQKAFTRTRISFETGVYQLGGYSLFLSSSDLQIGRGEPAQDTARALSRYLDSIIIRTYEQSEMEALAEYGSILVVNSLTDFAHPCQVPAGLMMIREACGQLDGPKMYFTGDGNNIPNSLAVGGPKMGMKVSVACLRDYESDAWVLELAKGNPNLFLTDKPEETVVGTDVVTTDVWFLMDTEAEKEKRQRGFVGYQINSGNLKLAAPEIMVLHCLPTHRGEEITEEVFEAHTDEIFEEAENRLHTQKTVSTKLLG